MEQNSRNRIIGLVVGIIAFAAAYVGIKQFFFKKTGFDKQMMEAASELNKTCPVMIDSETRLDNAIALPENIFQYNYTLINLLQEEIDTLEVHQNLDKSIINSVKTSPELKIYRDNKVTMGYYYRDKEGKYIMRLNVTPEMYE